MASMIPDFLTRINAGIDDILKNAEVGESRLSIMLS